jgi:CRP/FNR family transcriptional regulator, nitrogen fixation regulation protein
VQRGVVRTHKILNDGRRQITAFYFPGEVFGLERAENYGIGAEAVTTSQVASFRRAQIFTAASQSVEVARELWSRTAQNLQHAESHMLLLGRKTALEKVEAFLAEMDERTRRSGHINLPMTRLDISDYLGLTIETVSRCLGRMQDDGRLSLSGVRTMDLRPVLSLPLTRRETLQVPRRPPLRCAVTH